MWSSSREVKRYKVAVRPLLGVLGRHRGEGVEEYVLSFAKRTLDIIELISYKI